MKANTLSQYLVDYGKQVKSNRSLKKLTQKELAEQVGVSHEWICKIENGKVRTISLELMHLINDKLDIKT